MSFHVKILLTQFVKVMGRHILMNALRGVMFVKQEKSLSEGILDLSKMVSLKLPDTEYLLFFSHVLVLTCLRVYLFLLIFFL